MSTPEFENVWDIPLRPCYVKNGMFRAHVWMEDIKQGVIHIWDKPYDYNEVLAFVNTCYKTALAAEGPDRFEEWNKVLEDPIAKAFVSLYVKYNDDEKDERGITIWAKVMHHLMIGTDFEGLPGNWMIEAFGWDPNFERI